MSIILDPNELVITIRANPTTGAVECSPSRPIETAQLTYILGGIIVQYSQDAMLKLIRAAVGGGGLKGGGAPGGVDGGRKEGTS